MKGSLGQRLDLFARSAMPFAITIILLLLSLPMKRAPEIAPVLPALVLTSIYYWVVFRPDLMPPIAIFPIGIFSDLLLAQPLGQGTFLLLLVYILVASQRRFFAAANFALIWTAFALVVGITSLVSWGLSMAIFGAALEPGPVVLQAAATIAAYPFLAWLFGQAQRNLIREAK